MIRRPRTSEPLANRHVMNRGARRLHIFRNDGDREYFIHLLGRFALAYKVPIVSWSLMPNHYHLEPKTDGSALSLLMREIDRTYAQVFNQKYDTSGCLFQGPFKATWIDPGEGVAYVSRYIHLNCRDLGIKPEEYRWSSCRSYLGLEPIPAWLDPDPVLKMIRQPGKSDKESYRNYLAAAPPKAKRSQNNLDERDEFHIDFLRHLEEKYQRILEAANGMVGKLSLRIVVCWAANRIHRIPADTLAKHYGYSSAECLYALLSRFKQRLNHYPELQAILAKC